MDHISRKIFWIKKTDSRWTLLLEINNDEVYRVTIKSNHEYPYPYSIYKFDKFIEDEKSWSIAKKKSKYPIIVLASVQKIFLNHIFTNNVNIVVSTIDMNSESIEKRKFYCKKFFSLLEQNQFDYFESEQKTFYAYVAIKDLSIFKKEQILNMQSFINDRLSHFYIETD